MGLRTKPLGAYDCDGCTPGWHMSQREVDRCERSRVQRLAEGVERLQRRVTNVRFSRAADRLRARTPKRDDP
jgi:hypothetical protein